MVNTPLPPVVAQHGLRTSTAAPRVVGSLPPAEEFTRPVFGHVHQEQSAAGEMSENMMEFPVVQEQVIVQAFPVVVGSLPPAEEFAELVYNQFHQEQFSAGETTEIIPEIPVVQEQVIVHTIPRVVSSLPPAEVFTEPVYSHFHQEQFSAGVTIENTPEIPFVQEQVLVQAIPRFVGSLPPAEVFTASVARRPPPLAEVRPSVRAQRHVAEQLADIAPMVQILDSPVPQTSEQLLEVFRLLDTQMPVEQAIAVPKISLDRIPQRSFVLTPQSAEQLVEVPTVLTPTRIALQIAEQIVDTPVPRGRVYVSLPGQSSSSRRGDERAEVPKITLLLRMGTDSKRYRVPLTQPLRFVFRAYCRRLGLQESQVRFYCDGLLSPDHSPDLLGLEDGDVIEAEEVFVEDEEEEEDDEFDGTESRFPDGFLPMRMCRWFPSGNCRQGWECMFAHSVSELHPLSHEHDS